MGQMSTILRTEAMCNPLRWRGLGVTRLHFWFQLAGFLFALPTTASAAIINGDFATGDLTGWNVTATANGQSATATVVTSATDPHGSWVQLDTTGTSKESLLGTEVVEAVFVGTVQVSQTFNAIAGQVLSFDASWSADEALGSGVSLIGSSGTTLLLSVADVSPPPSISNGWQARSDGWQAFSANITESGTYTLIATSDLVGFIPLFNTGGSPIAIPAYETFVDDQLSIANVRLSSVPEPTTLVLAFVATAGVVMAFGNSWAMRTKKGS